MNEKISATGARAISRRQGLQLSAASIAASLAPAAFAAPAAANQKETIMDTTKQTRADATTVRPFRVNFAQADIDDLRRRISATKWPDREQVNDASQGVQLATTQPLPPSWCNPYHFSR